MKSIFVLFAFLIGVFVSCDSILDVSDNLDELGAVNEEVLFSSEESIEDVLNGVYYQFASTNYNGGRFFEMTSANTPYFSSGTKSSGLDFTNFNIPSELNGLFNAWDAMYKCIDGANQFIESIAIYAADMPSTPKNLGQAHFLRALTYFDLVRVWGEVPLRIEPANEENLFLPKSSKQEIYSQIISDLVEAKRLLPSENYQKGRPKSHAAAGYLAKVYMAMATETDEEINDGTDYWTLARTEAISVVGEYELVDSYAKLFEEGNENTDESIFEIQYSTGSTKTSGDYTRTTAPAKSIYNKRINGGGLRINKMAFHDHYSDYGYTHNINTTEHPDERIDATYISKEYMETSAGGIDTEKKIYPNTGNKGAGVNYLKKYREATNNQLSSGRNKIMFRYADLLLMLAEIEAEIGDVEVAKAYVKEVLDRADNGKDESGKSLYKKSKVGGMEREALKDRIMIERIYELLGEGHEWFDLRRQTIDGVSFLENRIIRRQELLFGAERGSEHEATGDKFIKNKNTVTSDTHNKDLQFILDDASILEKNMRFPIPLNEILGNNALNYSVDQNTHY